MATFSSRHPRGTFSSIRASTPSLGFWAPSRGRLVRSEASDIPLCLAQLNVNLVWWFNPEERFLPSVGPSTGGATKC